MSSVRDWSVPAHWYDAMNEWGSSDDFYLALVMNAPAVLDVGCGTGTLLRRARDTGETRHPQARAWDGWNTSFEVHNPDGEPVVVTYEVLDVQGDVVTLAETLTGRWWAQPQVEEGRLRFLDEDSLTAALTAAGCAVESTYGGWDRRPIDATSEEIVVVARR